ncbi:MAG: carboxylate--amine ligase [Pseudonocardiales bacterium]|nr:glutamate--cysteine ligase [Actinomycetota bacterium]PZS17528.1 MAG: carboxylate--amine ligase [Pseudonocardiales bacterium]
MPRSVGVEEELLLVDPDSGRALALAAAVLRDAGDGGKPADQPLTSELTRQQVETNTRPRTSLDDLASEVRRWRRVANEAAEGQGARVAALASSPLAVEPSISSSRRYQRMVDEFGVIAEEQLTCGCHVHVAIHSESEGVAVLDRIRGWLPCLLALSANSPFWQGHDSGYASFRSQVWGRWPSAGPTGLFGSAETYHATTGAMIKTRTLLDLGMVYFDARLSRLHPTVEVRVADVCLVADDAVLMAGLVRALVDTAARSWQAGLPADPVRTELLRLASWRAGRSGLDGDLVDPAGRPVPAAQVIGALVDHVRPVLDESGDLEVVEELVTAVLRRGNGAIEQRRIYRTSGELADVVAHAVDRTTS